MQAPTGREASVILVVLVLCLGSNFMTLWIMKGWFENGNFGSPQSIGSGSLSSNDMAHIQQVIEKALEHKLSNVVIEAPDWITAVPNGGVAAAERTPKVAASAATAVPSTVTVMPSASSGTWAPSLVDLIDKCKGWNPEAQAATARLKGVVGWFFEEETRFLYAMGRMCTGPLLEQGPYAGKSTSAWTSGLRDGEEKDGRQRQMFLTTDIFPVHPSVGPGTAGDTGYPYYWKREGSLVRVSCVSHDCYYDYGKCRSTCT